MFKNQIYAGNVKLKYFYSSKYLLPVEKTFFKTNFTSDILIHYSLKYYLVLSLTMSNSSLTHFQSIEY